MSVERDAPERNGHPRQTPVGAEHYTERYYLQACGGSEFFQRYGPSILKPQMAYALSKADIRPGMRVLDIGCGRGEILFHVRRLGGLGVGTDYATAALAIARKVSGCEVLQCDVKTIPFENASFDRIFFLGLMDHLHDWELEASFRQIGRVLKPGGYVLIHTCANRMYYKNWSYPLRRAAVGALKKLGLNLSDPSPPRSEEDGILHVNEHTGSSLRAFFARIGWNARVEAMPNYKILVRELYGSRVPDGFPLQSAPRWRVRLYRSFLWRIPVRWFLARELFCIASPHSLRPGNRQMTRG